MSKILLVASEHPLPSLLALALVEEGYAVMETTPANALERVERVCPDLVVLQAPLRDREPLTTLQHLLERRPRIPVLLVSTSWSEQDRPLRDSADAYAMAAPDMRPVRARVRELLNPHGI